MKKISKVSKVFNGKFIFLAKFRLAKISLISLLFRLPKRINIQFWETDMDFNIDKKHVLDFKIPHKNWDKARKLIFLKLLNSEKKDVITVLGPPRAGKSKLAESIIKEFSDNNNFNETQEIPVVYIIASNSANNGSFSTKDFNYKLLALLENPLFSESASAYKDNDLLKTRLSMTEYALKALIIEYFLSRKTKILIIDEAHHIRFTPKSQASHSVLDSWKCLAEETGIVLVIMGAFPLLETMRNTPHLVARSQKIIINRYKDTPSDKKEFSKIIDTFLIKLNTSDELKNTKEHYQLLFEGSLGCIGLLKLWLKNANVLAIVEERPIDLDILLETKLCDSDLDTIENEISTGEEFPDKRIDPMNQTNSSKYKQNKQTNKTYNSFKRNPKRMKGGNLDD